MKDFKIVIAEGDSLVAGCMALEDKIKKEYGKQDCFIECMQILPLAIPHALAGGGVRVVFVATAVVVFCKEDVPLLVDGNGLSAM
jgi:hypothetical protein